jgi:hypothetical protein
MVIALPDGWVVLDRSMLTGEGRGRIHQVIGISRDGGATWELSFDTFYVRKS